MGVEFGVAKSTAAPRISASKLANESGAKFGRPDTNKYLDQTCKATCHESCLIHWCFEVPAPRLPSRSPTRAYLRYLQEQSAV